MNTTRANVIRGTDLVYSQTKSSVDSQKPCAVVAGYRFGLKKRFTENRQPITDCY